MTKLTAAPGWVVSGEHPDILNYVSPEDFTEPEPNLIQISVLGRSRRDQDAKGIKVIRVEDHRPNRLLKWLQRLIRLGSNRPRKEQQ